MQGAEGRSGGGRRGRIFLSSAPLLLCSPAPLLSFSPLPPCLAFPSVVMRRACPSPQRGRPLDAGARFQRALRSSPPDLRFALRGFPPRPLLAPVRTVPARRHCAAGYSRETRRGQSSAAGSSRESRNP